MTACKPLIGSNTRLAIIPNPTCLNTPKVERVISTVAIAAADSTAIIGLNPAYVAGGYTATTVKTIYANTILFFGASQTPIKVLKDYNLTTTPQIVEIELQNNTVAANATADTYLAAILCLNSKQINTNTQSGNANEDCDEGLLKSFYVGVTRDMAITGQVSSSVAVWAILQRVGAKLENVFFYMDINRLSGDYGLMQLAPFTYNNNQVGSVVDFASQGSILKIDTHLPANLVGTPDPLNPGQVVLTVTGLAAQNTVRRLYGFKDLTIQ